MNWTAAVAGVALCAGISWGLWHYSVVHAPVAKTGRGQLVGSNGRPATALASGEFYSARIETVVSLDKETRIKAVTGAQFSLTRVEDGTPAVDLAQGGMYASADGSAGPLRISTRRFDTELHAGQVLVAQEANDDAGYVIVLEGQAQVRTDSAAAPLPLRAGQVFVSSGSGESVFIGTLAVDDLPRLAQDQRAFPESSDMRQRYEQTVKDYRQELLSLETQLATLPETTPGDEMRERHQRVATYLQAHEEKLEALRGTQRLQQVPFEEIERGLLGFSDPANWL